ncbi:MAG: signal peptidase II [Elusimicrobiota bacterium]
MKFFIIFSVFIIDQFLKFLVVVNMKIGESIELLPVLNITYLKNTGMAFSFLQGNNDVLLAVNIGIIVLLAGVLKFTSQKDKFAIVAYSLILGGALSNLWDRIFYEGVVDFINLKVWPVFNIADTAITMAALIIVYSVFSDYMKKKRGMSEDAS